MKIVARKFPETQYFKQEMPKRIIVLHHTVSGIGAEGDINWWEKTPERIGTPYIVGRDATITQIFDDKHWIHHLGIPASFLKKYGSPVSNERLNQLSIGVELDSWGGLTKKNGVWYAGNSVIPNEKVQEYPKGFRGFYGFEKYTPEQIQATKELLQFLSAKYKISLKYNEDMWDVSKRALVGTWGLWSHVSYRSDKSDLHPQPELIAMLKSLEP